MLIAQHLTPVSLSVGWLVGQSVVVLKLHSFESFNYKLVGHIFYIDPEIENDDDVEALHVWRIAMMMMMMMMMMTTMMMMMAEQHFRVWRKAMAWGEVKP